MKRNDSPVAAGNKMKHDKMHIRYALPMHDAGPSGAVHIKRSEEAKSASRWSSVASSSNLPIWSSSTASGKGPIAEVLQRGGVHSRHHGCLTAWLVRGLQSQHNMHACKHEPACSATQHIFSSGPLPQNSGGAGTLAAAWQLRLVESIWVLLHLAEALRPGSAVLIRHLCGSAPGAGGPGGHRRRGSPGAEHSLRAVIVSAIVLD